MLFWGGAGGREPPRNDHEMLTISSMALGQVGLTRFLCPRKLLIFRVKMTHESLAIEYFH